MRGSYSRSILGGGLEGSVSVSMTGVGVSASSTPGGHDMLRGEDLKMLIM